LRILNKVITGVSAAAAVALMVATPALADPPSGTTPKAGDVVGVGSDTIQNVMDQFSVDYNASHSTGAKLYSWDATNPKTGAIHDSIKTKSGCKTIPRPDGSSEGITALTTENASTGGHPCIDFARSSRDRAPTDPPFAKGGIAFVDLAGDAVTWSTQATTNAPADLSTAELTAIYQCKVTNWSQVGGKSGTIKAFIPQTGSGTRAFFLSAIGVTTPGSCVSDDNGQLEENEGVNPVLKSVNAIFPYSVGKYLAERYHSAKCLNSSCTPNTSGVVCKPSGSQNKFGCDTHGTMVLHTANGTKPTTPWPLTNSTTTAVINSGFSANFQRTLFDVVKFSTGTSNGIPSYLEGFFGPKGWVCTNSKAKSDLRNYGFRVLTAGSTAGDCGSSH
jgi:ABC-type phosphate transport system substrate-binding protein